MTTAAEVKAVSEVLADGRDFLADAISYYGAIGVEADSVVADDDREMVAALDQALDYLAAFSDAISN